MQSFSILGVLLILWWWVLFIWFGLICWRHLCSCAIQYQQTWRGECLWRCACSPKMLWTDIVHKQFVRLSELPGFGLCYILSNWFANARQIQQHYAGIYYHPLGITKWHKAGQEVEDTGEGETTNEIFENIWSQCGQWTLTGPDQQWHSSWPQWGIRLQQWGFSSSEWFWNRLWSKWRKGRLDKKEHTISTLHTQNVNTWSSLHTHDMLHRPQNTKGTTATPPPIIPQQFWSD